MRLSAIMNIHFNFAQMQDLAETELVLYVDIELLPSEHFLPRFMDFYQGWAANKSKATVGNLPKSPTISAQSLFADHEMSDRRI